MQWHEIRERYPHQWLLVEAIEAHSTEGHRLLDELAVVQEYADGEAAMRGYLDIHRRSPGRELYVLHTDRERLDIDERGVALSATLDEWASPEDEEAFGDL